MTTKINLIIALSLFFLIIIYKIIIKRKNKIDYKSALFEKTNKLKKILYIISSIMFPISIIINIIVIGKDSSLNTSLTYIINALTITILFLPLSLDKLYEISFNNEEKISHTKTIITNIINPKIIKKLNKAGINVIILSSEKHKLKIKTITEDEIEKKYLSKNIIIQTDNLKIVDKLINKTNVYYEFENLNDAYNKIYNARGVHDNYIRSIKYLITTYLPLYLSFIFLNIIKFPVDYNILLVIMLKIFTIIITTYLYRNLPYDNDIMTRKPKNVGIVMGHQEIILIIIESFFIFFMLNVPYMFVLSQGGTQSFANTLYYTVFIFTNLFMTYSYISESNFIKNIFKSLKNIRIIIYTIICILITLFFNFNSYFNTRNIEIHNYIACVFFGIISILLMELIKLARFTTQKGRKKNELKNNKKRARS